MLKLITLILVSFAPAAFSYNDFGPLTPNSDPNGGLVWVDLGSGTGGGVGGRWFQCYGTTLDNPLNYTVCGASSNPYTAYDSCLYNGWVNISCQFTRL